MVRDARRRVRLSQREMARRAGVSVATVTGIESGTQLPSLRVLQELLAVAGLELCVDRPVQPACRHVLRHLHRSLSIRLHLALGGSGRPWNHPLLAPWQQLGLLATSGRLFVTGELAVALWLPGTGAVRERRVGFEPRGRRFLPPTPELTVVPGPLPGDCTVTVPLGVGSLVTPPPGALALRPEHAAVRRALRGVAAHLDQHAPRDPAGRRTPAHREPRREEEQWRLLFARRWNGRLRRPDPLDARGWRLDDEASFDQWIERRAGRG